MKNLLSIAHTGRCHQRDGNWSCTSSFCHSFAAAVTKSMWEVPALLAGHSARKDLVRLVEFDAAFRAADFFPSWSPDLYSGYGSPIFQFYAPLSYYAAEVPVLMGLDYATALKLTQLLALFFSGLAMYRLASMDFPGWMACVGAIFYMSRPTGWWTCSSATLLRNTALSFGCRSSSGARNGSSPNPAESAWSLAHWRPPR